MAPPRKVSELTITRIEFHYLDREKDMNQLILLLCAASVAACTTPVPPMADMRGKDIAQYNLDYTACKHENPGLMFLPEEVMKDCMRTKGWTILE